MKLYSPQANNQSGERGHGWMMIACCISLLVIAVVLAAVGIARTGFVFAALICMLMMAVTMGVMSVGHDRK